MEMDIIQLREICKKLKLLYIEDDDNTRETTMRMFKHFFDDISFAKDGIEGLEKFHNDSFDLIISDINMPKMNGIEMLKRVRARDSSIPFLFISAHSESDYFLKSIALGADYFIIKPIQQTQLHNALNNIAKKIEYERLHQNYQNALESELIQKTLEIKKKMFEDELTGLGSRHGFFDEINSSQESIVWIIDIEKFHVVNDLYGYQIGNYILKEFGSFLQYFAQKYGRQVYRISGDQFAMIKEEKTLDTDLEEIILNSLFEKVANTQFTYEESVVKLHIHCGVGFGKKSAFEHASIALDSAKSSQKDYLFYSQKNDRTQEQYKLMQGRQMIQSAIAQKKVVAVYQAIVDTNKNISKYEVLMRIQGNENKLISPYHFLSTAMKTGLYEALSIDVIHQGLEKLKNSDRVLSFNFTYKDIVNNSFISELEDYFKSSPNRGAQVIFELTETESMQSYELVKTFIAKFRKYGVQIAIDDFGTGFSNFSYILEMEPDFLKIDGSLIKDIDTNPKSLILSKAIIEFCKKLNIKTIAEYVHNQEIFEILKELGVDQFQGYHFHQPGSLKD